MIRLFLLSERQMARISPYFPLSHGVPRVNDRRVVSGIVSVIKNGLQWKDARLWSAQDALQPLHPRGVFDRIFAALASQGPKPERSMSDATYLKTRRAS
jgi:transposase